MNAQQKRNVWRLIDALETPFQEPWDMSSFEHCALAVAKKAGLIESEVDRSEACATFGFSSEQWKDLFLPSQRRDGFTPFYGVYWYSAITPQMVADKLRELVG